MSAHPTGPLLAVLITSSVVLGIALILTRTWLRHRPALRSAVCTTTFGVLLAIPLAVALASTTTAGPRLLAYPPASTATVADDLPAAPSEVSASTSTPTATPSTSNRDPIDATTVGGIVWATGASLVLLPLLLSWWRVRRLRAAAVPLLDEHWRDARARIDVRLGVRRSYALAHGVVASPVAAGVLRPVVVVPDHWTEREPTPELEAVLAHEVAHVARWDGLRAVVARLAVAAYWLHPLVWVLHRDAAIAREEACDNHALGFVSASAFADSLLELSISAPGPRLGALAPSVRGWSLEQRVRGLLAADRDRSPAAARSWTVGYAVALALVGVALAACTTPADDDKGNATASTEAPSDLTLPSPLTELGFAEIDTWTLEFVHDYGDRGFDYTLPDGRTFPNETNWRLPAAPVLQALAQSETRAHHPDRWPEAEAEFVLFGKAPDGDHVQISYLFREGWATVSRRSPDGSIRGGEWRYRGGDDALVELMRTRTPSTVQVPTAVVGRAGSVTPPDDPPSAYWFPSLEAAQGHLGDVWHSREPPVDGPAGVWIAVYIPDTPDRSLRLGHALLRDGSTIDLQAFDWQLRDGDNRTNAALVHVEVPDPDAIETVHVHLGTDRILTARRGAE